MPSFDSENRSLKDRFKDRPANENLVAEQDLLMEQILENINTTPIGQVLKKIATLPEVRRKKVLNVRQQLSNGKYRLNERLDIALDRVLEDLTT
jgi:predicted XRE-type DNA-binding protein